MLNGIIIVLSIICTLYVFYLEKIPQYQYITLLPLSFFITYIIFLSRIIKHKVSVFNIVFIVFMFFRYCIMSVGMALCGITVDIYDVPKKEVYTESILIMVYELLILSFVLYYLNYKKSKNSIKKISTKYNSSYFIYYIFILFVFVLCLIKPEVLSCINILIPSNEKINLYNKFDEFEQLISLLVIVCKNLIFIILINKITKLYKSNSNIGLYILSLVLLIINISIFYSVNRMEIIITAIASFLIINSGIFKKYLKITTSIAFILLIILIPIVTETRNMQLINNKKDIINSLTETMQLYQGGLDSVAVAIKTSYDFDEHRNLEEFVYNLLRPVIGINMFFKNSDHELVNSYFNYNIFGSYNLEALIIPFIGQSYFFCGYVAAPLFMCIFLLLGYKLDKIARTTECTEIKFFMYMCVIRLAMMSGFNFTILMNTLSMELIIPLIVIFLNKTIVINKKMKEERYGKNKYNNTDI